jgi:tRNA (cytidine/uridine-2'-O-)-methyltransferase
MAAGARLHLIKPLGFSLENKYLKRAGLDYWQDLDLEIHDSWNAFTSSHPDAPLWFFTTKAARRHDEAVFENRVFLVFGKETAGIPDNLLKENPERCLRIPLLEKARSLNLSVAVGVAAYEALRQNRFAGLSESDPEGRLF